MAARKKKAAKERKEPKPAEAPKAAPKPGRHRWLIRLAVVLVVGLAASLWVVTQGSSGGALVVENRSGQPLAALQVSVGGQTRTFRDVADGGEVSAAFDGGGAFEVEGRLADGTRLKGRFPAV